MSLVRKEIKMSRISDIVNKEYGSEYVEEYTPFSDSLHSSNKKQVLNQEIDKPKHYASKSGKDVIDWCEDFGIMGNAYVFNIFKYLCRAGKKDNNSELQDALKAEVYLKRYIESLKNAQ